VSPGRTLIDLWNMHASRGDAGERVAVVDAQGERSFRAVDAQARAIAAALLGSRATLGGERVAVFAPPGAAFVSAFVGVLAAGGCAVVLSPLHAADESRYLLEDAGVQTLVVDASLDEAARAFAGRRAILRPDAESAPLATAVTALPGDPALQLYTSGTTGKPKGAVLSHENLAVQAQLLHAAWGWTRDDVLLHALPLHHMHGLVIALVTALTAGARARMMPFHAARLWDAMAEATVFMAVPTMYAKLFAAFDEADDGTRARWSANAAKLRLATSGSAALPVTLGDRWKAITGRYPLERYGMTEIGVGLTTPLEGERVPGCVGAPLPTVETRIVGEGGKDADVGELWVRGPSVFARYHERPEETARSFAPAEGGGPAWFMTGDTVTRENGSFKILGRTSVDIIKSGGYKLSALEIEEALREHPAVLEVAVVGLPDETWGERVVACVVPRAGRDAECAEDSLRAFAKQKLASYKVPKEVRRMAELPRNAIGKVVKPELAKLLAGGGA
jgi:malonyl-CoA/methylmalonyl-CoA synthetase